MKDGFISVACGTPKLRLADCHYNAEQTFIMMRQAEKSGVKVLVLPELGLTGYSFFPTGSRTAMVVPFSELSSTQTRPACRLAISQTSESLSPAPPYCRLRDLSTRKKGWKMLR